MELRHIYPSEKEVLNKRAPPQAPPTNSDTCTVHGWKTSISCSCASLWVNVNHNTIPYGDVRRASVMKLEFLQLKHEARNTNVDRSKKTEYSCIRFMKPTRAACARSVSKGSGRPKSPPWGLWCHPKLGLRKGWWTHRRHPSGKDRAKNGAISQAAWGSRETVH